MKFQSLHSLHKYCSQKDGDCRRMLLLGIIESPRQNKCGFCDTCDPTLSFEGRENAVIDEKDDDFWIVRNEFIRECNIHPTLKTVDAILEKVYSKKTEVGFIGEALRELSDNPNKIGALYLSADGGRRAGTHFDFRLLNSLSGKVTFSRKTRLAWG